MKKVLFVMLMCLVGAAFAQDPNPATSLPTFTINASILSLPSTDQVGVATDIGATFKATKNWYLRADNILAPVYSSHSHYGGIQGPIPVLNKFLATKTNFDPAHFQPYMTASVGASHTQVNGVDHQGASYLAGGGINYDPAGTGKFSVGLIEVRWAHIPGISNSTAIVQSSLKLGW